MKNKYCVVCNKELPVNSAATRKYCDYICSSKITNAYSNGYRAGRKSGYREGFESLCETIYKSSTASTSISYNLHAYKKGLLEGFELAKDRFVGVLNVKYAESEDFECCKELIDDIKKLLGGELLK